MKKMFFFLVGIFVLGLNAKADKEHIPTLSDYQAFLKSKTLVVMDQNPMSDFNFKIKEVMKNVWTITEYEFVSQKEFDAKKGDPKYSFLTTTTVTFNMDKTKAKYNFLSLMMGKPRTMITDLPDLCSIPLAYSNVEDDSYAYKMDAFISFIQDHIKLMLDQPDLIKPNVFKYYNKNLESLNDKTLLLVKEDLAPEINTISKVKSLYPYDVKIVSQSEVEKALHDKDPNVVVFHKVGPEGTKSKARCYKIFIGAGDSKFYYFDYHMINRKNPDGLLESDLKKMSK